MTVATETWLGILEKARFTPSPHNTQPWKIKIVSADHAELFLDHARALPAEDTTGSFIRCALGMFAEACALIAPHFKFACDVQYHDTQPEKSESLEKIANLRLSASQERAPYALEALAARQTSRLKLDDTLIDDGEVEVFNRVAATFGHTFHHISNSDTIESIMSYDLEATIQDLNTPSYRDEIRRWFRYSEISAQRHKDGLSAKCMVIPPIEFYLMAHFPWSAKIPAIGSLVRARYRALIGRSPQLGILEGNFFTRRDAFQTGRGFMRLWLELSTRGLYLHPFGNLITNGEAKARLMNLTGIKNPWIVFRFGSSKKPPVAARLPLERILL
jgi:hypothetical protein